MGLQVEFLLVVMLVISCCGNIEARNAKRIIFSDRLAHSNARSEEQYPSGPLCALCEQYSSQALFYLNQNETQTEILSLLYQSCTKLQSLRQQCITLVDYYVPLFFTEVATISSDEFCEKVHLCKEYNAIKLPTSGTACKLCHRAVLDIILTLQDPSTQARIFEMLTKACAEVQHDFAKCYDLVSQYVPEVMNNAEAFLEKNNICASVCKADVPATTYIFTN